MSKGVRTRTGCLTCRRRKLKCDEQKPVCGQCQKGTRSCQFEPGLIFRHQQNPSMNQNNTGVGLDDSLQNFFKYSDTFDIDTVWVDIPKQITFINTTNPYADPPSPERDPPYQKQRRSRLTKLQKAQLGADADIREVIEGFGQTHGLEALSTVASVGQHPYVAPGINMSHRSTPFESYHDPYLIDRSTPVRDGNLLSASSDQLTISSNKNPNFILDPTSAMNSMIDPHLGSSHTPVNGSLPLSRAEADSITQSNLSESDGDIQYMVAPLPYHL